MSQRVSTFQTRDELLRAWQHENTTPNDEPETPAARLHRLVRQRPTLALRLLEDWLHGEEHHQVNA